MPSSIEHPHAQPAALAGAIAARLRGDALLRVSGGRSPVALFECLREQPLDWSRLSVQLVDERCLPDGHPERNETLLRQHLLRGPAAAARLLPLDDAHAARRADVTVLGMGEDGHTASLFPGMDSALQPDADPAVVRARPAHAPHERVSLNLAALLGSDHHVLSIAGPAKWAVYQRAACAPDATLPISLVLHHATHPVAVWHAD